VKKCHPLFTMRLVPPTLQVRGWKAGILIFPQGGWNQKNWNCYLSEVGWIKKRNKVLETNDTQPV
jgi:hypothetical protein